MKENKKKNIEEIYNLKKNNKQSWMRTRKLKNEEDEEEERILKIYDTSLISSFYR